jgi:DNA-binding Lrp family transcriptional regulator
MATVKIDKYDEKIINELISNAKIPLRKLAQKLGISFVTVMNRIRKLEKFDIIKGYQAEVSHEKLGYGVHILMEVRISKGKLFELEKKISKSDNVYAVYDITGEFDAIILAKFKSTRTMDVFLKKVQTYDFVERTNTKLILNTIKQKQIML